MWMFADSRVRCKLGHCSSFAISIHLAGSHVKNSARFNLPLSTTTLQKRASLSKDSEVSRKRWHHDTNDFWDLGKIPAA